VGSNSLNPELVAPLDIKGLAPDMNLLTGGDPDVPVALGLVWVVRRVVGCLNGHLLSISQGVATILA